MTRICLHRTCSCEGLELTLLHSAACRSHQAALASSAGLKEFERDSQAVRCRDVLAEALRACDAALQAPLWGRVPRGSPLPQR